MICARIRPHIVSPPGFKRGESPTENKGLNQMRDATENVKRMISASRLNNLKPPRTHNET